MLTTLWSVFIG